MPRPASRPSIRCNHLLGSLPIESYTSALIAADLSIMMGHQAAQQACPHAPALPAHLCSCTLHFSLATMCAHASMPCVADGVVALCARIGATVRRSKLISSGATDAAAAVVGSDAAAPAVCCALLCRCVCLAEISLYSSSEVSGAFRGSSPGTRAVVANGGFRRL